MSLISSDWVDSVYTKLGNLDVVLDPNPLEHGPAVLNQKTSEVRTALSNVEKLFMEVSHNLHTYKRKLTTFKLQFGIEITRLIASDPHVRAGRSQSEREALASTKLTHLTVQINSLELAVQDLDAVLTVIKAKRTDLKDIQNRLKDQLRLCQEQIMLGQRWGRSPSLTLTPPLKSPLAFDNAQEEDSFETVQVNEDLTKLFDDILTDVELNGVSKENPFYEMKSIPELPTTLVEERKIVTYEEVAGIPEDQAPSIHPTINIVSDFDYLMSLTKNTSNPESLWVKKTASQSEIDEFLKYDPKADLEANKKPSLEDNLADLFDGLL